MPASRILVGHDGSPHAEDALAPGRLLSELTGAELVLARIVPWEPLSLQAMPIPELRNRYEEQELSLQPRRARGALPRARGAASHSTRVGRARRLGGGRVPGVMPCPPTG
jgi:hypothetical protein